MRLAVLAVFTIVWLCAPGQWAAASGSSSHVHAVNWGEHDTAVYVVSTMNLLRTRSGRPVPAYLENRAGVTRFQVYADSEHADLYFIVLKRSDGSTYGTFAYQMGWLKPEAVTPIPTRLNVRRAAKDVVDAFRNDQKELLDTFSSTLPQ